MGAIPTHLSSSLALRPLRAPEIIDAGIQLARRHYGPLATTALLSLLPYFAMDLYTNIVQQAGTWTLLLFSAAVASIADAATAKVAFDAYRGEAPSPTRAFRALAKRAWPVLMTGVYRTAMTLAGLIVLVLPGLYLFEIYALVPSIALFEPQLSARGALKRSYVLTTGAKARALLCYVLPYGVVIGANILITQFTKEIMGTAHGSLASGFAGSATAALLTPFLASLQVVLYVDCRVRSEAFDLELALAETTAPRDAMEPSP
jgi:hypothetical protein